MLLKSFNFQGKIAFLIRHPYFIPTVLVVLGLATRFAFISYPAEVVFDEVHFGKFVNAYFTGEYYFDIHPPLGKLLVALSAWVGGYRGGFPFLEIGNPYGPTPLASLRFLPNLAGGLVPLSFYFFLRTLGTKQGSAGFAALLLVFDNALLAQSHFILVDAFLMLFGFLGLAGFFLARSLRNPVYHWGWLALGGVFFGAASSIKWTGLGFLGFAFLVFLWDIFLARQRKILFLQLFLSLLLIPFAFYLLAFFFHFLLLPASGPGDAFMSEAFLRGEKGFSAKFLELNGTMYRANATLTATHSYASEFYTWPLMLRPVYYWVKDFGGGLTGRIYFLGNPFVWWFGTLGLFFGLRLLKKRESLRWLYLGYLLNWLPFALVGRVLFLYHYLVPLAFSLAIFSSFWFDWLNKNWQNKRQLAVGAILILVVLGFLFFAPLTYGLPLSEKAYKLRVWLPSWI